MTWYNVLNCGAVHRIKWCSMIRYYMRSVCMGVRSWILFCSHILSASALMHLLYYKPDSIYVLWMNFTNGKSMEASCNICICCMAFKRRYKLLKPRFRFLFDFLKIFLIFYQMITWKSVVFSIIHCNKNNKHSLKYTFVHFPNSLFLILIFYSYELLTHFSMYVYVCVCVCLSVYLSVSRPFYMYLCRHFSLSDKRGWVFFLRSHSSKVEKKVNRIGAKFEREKI